MEGELDRGRLEPTIFGTSDATAIYRLLDEFCRRELGKPIRSVLFHRTGVASVRGLELSDGRKVVLKVHRQVSAAQLETIQRVQAQLAARGLCSSLPAF